MRHRVPELPSFKTHGLQDLGPWSDFWAEQLKDYARELKKDVATPPLSPLRCQVLDFFESFFILIAFVFAAWE